MEQTERISNPVVREYLYRFAPEKLEKNPTFVKVFGSGFAKRRLKANLLTAYTNERNSVKPYRGYHQSSDKSVTLCFAGEEGELLSPEDIEKNPLIQEVALHECIHAIFDRRKKECKEMDIIRGTGLLECYKDPRSGALAELGRGANEGWTVWLCKKIEGKTKGYPELKNLISLIELAIGEEQVMELGKGDSQHIFANILKMKQSEVNYFLSVLDEIYNVNDYLQILHDVSRIIQNYLKIQQNEVIEKKEEYEKDYEEYKALIEGYMKEPEFLDYLKKEGKAASLSVFQEYLKEVCIPKNKTRKHSAIITAESFILDRYFTKELRDAFNQETISDDSFERTSKILFLLNTNLNAIPEHLKDLKAPLSAIYQKRRFEEFAEKYMTALAQKEAEKYQNGELAIEDFANTMKKIFGNHTGLLLMFLNKFNTHIAPGFQNELNDILYTMCHAPADKELPKKLLNSSVYRLSFIKNGKTITRTIIGKENQFFDQSGNGKDLTTDMPQEPELEFLPAIQVEDKYQKMMDKLVKVKEMVLAKDPNARVYIVNQIVVIQQVKDTRFFMVDNEKLIPLTVEAKLDLQFQAKEKESANLPEKKELMVPKVSLIANISNRIKRIWNDWKNKGMNSTPNYVEKKESTLPETRMETYRVEDFEERRKRDSIQEKSLQEHPAQDTNPKEEQR